MSILNLIISGNKKKLRIETQKIYETAVSNINTQNYNQEQIKEQFNIIIDNSTLAI